jgi:transcription factor E
MLKICIPIKIPRKPKQTPSLNKTETFITDFFNDITLLMAKKKTPSKSKEPAKKKTTKTKTVKKKKDPVLEKLLKRIITDYAGPESEKLVDLLYNKKNVNEFLIAKKMNLTINQTRNMLYKLGDEGLVRFIRKKDKKKGGWYTYFWTLKIRKTLEKFRDILDSDLKELENQRNSRQNERYYYDPLADIEYTEEEAILNDYTGPETGEVLEVKDNSEAVEQIKNQITDLESTRAYLDQEIEILKEKQERAKERRLKAEAKEKAEERARRRAERAKEREKLKKKEERENKKKGKKTTKKKSKKKKKV